MLISIQDVPRAARHLVFCSDPRLTRPELDVPIPLDERGAQDTNERVIRTVQCATIARRGS